MARRNTALDVLERAWKKIEDPDRWVKKSERSYKRRPDGKRYVAHCALGAVKSVGCDPAVRKEALSILATSMPPTPRVHRRSPINEPIAQIWHYNDRRATTHADIKCAFQKAIRRASRVVASDIGEIPDIKTVSEPVAPPVPILLPTPPISERVPA